MSVYYRKNVKRWYGTYFVDGHRKYLRTDISVPTSKGKKLAIDELTKIKAHVLEGKIKLEQPGEIIVFNDLIQDYIHTYLPGLETCKDEIAKCKIINEYFKDIRVDKLTSYHGEVLKTSLLKKGLSKASVNRYLFRLSSIMTHAVKKDIIHKNPIFAVKKFKEDNSRETLITYEEEKRLIECAAPHIRPIITMAIYTGCRLREILSLKYEQINWDERYITLIKTKNQRKQKVPMNNTVYNLLYEMKKTTVSEYVFTYRNKQMDNIHKAFVTARNLANIDPEFKFHSCRHLFATRLIRANTDIVIVKEILGHADLKTTLRYITTSHQSNLKAVYTLDTIAQSEDIQSSTTEITSAVI